MLLDALRRFLGAKRQPKSLRRVPAGPPIRFFVNTSIFNAGMRRIGEAIDRAVRRSRVYEDWRWMAEDRPELEPDWPMDAPPEGFR